MSVILYRMPTGIPGAVSRPGSPTTIEQVQLLAGNPPLSYGVPVAIDSATGRARPIGASDTAASVYGVLVRPFPSEGSNTLGDDTPSLAGIHDVLKSGYICVKVNGSTIPVKNGPVYVRTAANGANTIIGGIEAAPDTTYSFLLTNAYFTGATDASGNGEIAYRRRG